VLFAEASPATSLTFGRGTSLTPVPPVTPIGMGKDPRGVDQSMDDLDEGQVAS
jgi:hypothetical protein